jgi:DNA polymerase I-like protein with 3'-5' exonuclease and polymerase domains
MIDKLCLDWETYYDKEFSLSKLTTEEYVRDARFQIIGVGIKFNNNPARWFTGASNVNDVMRMIPWHKVALLCHNTNFDGFILSEHFGLSPRLYLDTLSMARPWHFATVGGSLKKLAEHYELGAKGTEVVQAMGKRLEDFTPEELAQYGEYCKNDCELTSALFDKLAAKTPVNELLLIDRTVRMFCQPKLVIDMAPVAQHLEEEIARKEALLVEVEAIAPKEVLMSNPKLQQLLESLGVDVPMKITPTGRLSPAFGKTDKEFTALLDYEGHNAELVQAIIAARLGVKSTIDETRAQRFIGIAQRGPLPVDLQYCGAATTQRWSGGSKLNLQNLRRGGVLRRALMAPEGQVVVAVDSSNIELRVNHTLAGQDDTVAMFREGRDLYCEFASILFDRPITKADKSERQLGKLAHLSLGYGCGADKFLEICRLNGVTLTPGEAKKIVTLWRDTYARIPKLWRACNAALSHILSGAETWIDEQQLCRTGKECITTKPHNQILYPGLNQQGDKWTYKVRNETKYIYGAKVVENVCIEGSTLVLTEYGWKPLNTVGTEWVHDGVEFVPHGGIVFNGIQQCVTVDSVFMTPTHEVLTDEGWKPALEKPEPYRPIIRNAHCDTTEPLGREKNALAFQVYLRQRADQERVCGNPGSEARGGTELRMRNEEADRREEHDARNEPPPGLRCVAQYVRQVQTAYASSMEKLRSAWDSGLRRMGGILRELLARHGGNVPSWAYARSVGQQRRLRYAELCVENSQTTSTEYSSLHRSGYVCFVGADGGASVDAVLPVETGASAHKVYDIVNCGPRNRFVVLGEEGPFIVHNCQHLARNIIADQLLAISAKYPVVLTVHDEVVYLAPEAEADEALAFGIAAMSTSPTWWPAIPLAAEGEYGRTYS